MSKDNAKAIYTVPMVARKLKVTEPTVRRWIRDGDLKAEYTSRKEGNQITQEALCDFLQKNPKYGKTFTATMAGAAIATAGASALGTILGPTGFVIGALAGTIPHITEKLAANRLQRMQIDISKPGEKLTEDNVEKGIDEISPLEKSAWELLANAEQSLLTARNQLKELTEERDALNLRIENAEQQEQKAQSMFDLARQAISNFSDQLTVDDEEDSVNLDDESDI